MGSGVRLIAQCLDFNTDILSTTETSQGHAVRERIGIFFVREISRPEGVYELLDMHLLVYESLRCNKKTPK